jgi:hypothetical protein
MFEQGGKIALNSCDAAMQVCYQSNKKALHMVLALHGVVFRLEVIQGSAKAFHLLDLTVDY